MTNKEHWENIYTTKTPTEVSWTETYPKISIELLTACNAPKNAAIIDIGGGDSLIVDSLLALGYTDISVLDISAAAIERAKRRLGEDASKITWIVADILDFKPSKNYYIWHDRAVFHFLTTTKDIALYTELTGQCASHLVMGTFSENGPKKCSGLDISQYSTIALAQTFEPKFHLCDALYADHKTPFGTVQNFTFVRMSAK